MRFPGLVYLLPGLSGIIGWSAGRDPLRLAARAGDQHEAPGPVLSACRPHHYNIITPVHWSPSTRHPVITTWRIDMKNNLIRIANDTHLSLLSLQRQWHSPLPVSLLHCSSNWRWPGDLSSVAHCWVTIRLSRGCNDLLRLCCNVMCNVLCVTCDRTRYNVRDIVTLIPESQLSSHKAHR